VKGFQKAPKYHVISQVQWWPKVGHHKIQIIFIVSQIAYINICSLQMGNNIKFQLLPFVLAGGELCWKLQYQETFDHHKYYYIMV